MHFHRRPNGVFGVIGIGQRHIEDGQNRIALELGNDAAVSFDDFNHRGKKAVQNIDYFLRLQAFRHGRETGKIDEQNRRTGRLRNQRPAIRD